MLTSQPDCFPRSSAVEMSVQMPNLNTSEVELVEAPAEYLPEVSPGSRYNFTYVVVPKIGSQAIALPHVHIKYAVSEISR